MYDFWEKNQKKKLYRDGWADSSVYFAFATQNSEIIYMSHHYLVVVHTAQAMYQ